jgi:hypothetical protein
MYECTISRTILDFIGLIRDAISELEVEIWPESDLFLELQRINGELVEDEDGHKHCGYYFVYSPKRCIYWPEKVTFSRSMSKFLNATWGHLSESQKRESLLLDLIYITHLTVG